MWKPQKFKTIYLFATLYVLTLTLPSASAVYWAFGDLLLNHSNAFALLPRNGFRDTAVILMLIHQVIMDRIHFGNITLIFVNGFVFISTSYTEYLFTWTPCLLLTNFI